MAITFIGGWPRQVRHRLNIYVGIPIIAGLLAVTLEVPVLDAWLSSTPLVLIAGAWIVVSILLGRRYRFRIARDGLVREGHLRERTFPWDTFEEIEEIDSGLLLHRRGWRLPVEAEFADETPKNEIIDTISDRMAGRQRGATRPS